MAYFEQANYDPTSFYNTQSHSASEETLLLATSLGLGINSYSSMATSDVVYPLYDPDSPFNSPIVPIKTLGKDGRMKTSLMGIGTDEGFLTSPLIFGKHRNSDAETPKASTSLLGDSQAASPAVTPHLSDGRRLSSNSVDNEITPGSTPRNSIGSLSNYGGGTLPLNFGISAGRTSMGMLGGTNAGSVGGLELDYTTTTIPRNYESPQSQPIQLHRPTTNSNEYPNYSELVPSLPTFGRGRSILPTSTSSKFVEHRFPISPPLQTGTAVTSTARKPSKAYNSTRQISKAKSCPSLTRPLPQIEPLTPNQVSRQLPNYNVPGVPYNSPVDNKTTQLVDKYGNLDTVKVEPSVMPFSFADLYNFGLAVDSVEEIDPRKSPYQFANDLLLAENGGIGIGLGGYTDESEFNILHSLPTPYLAHGSGFSSPSSIYLSDTSPELGMAYLSPGQLSTTSLHSAPSIMSNPMMSNPSMTSNSSMISNPSMLGGPSIISSTSMIPGASLDTNSHYTHLSPGLAPAQIPVPSTSSRQRCLNYASQQSMIYSDPPPIDPSHLQSPIHQRTHSRALSSPGVAHFSYPSRFAPDLNQTRQHLSPYHAPTAISYEYSPMVDPSLFLPLPPLHSLQAPELQQIPTIRNNETFERNLETFDDIYEAYSQASTNYSTPNKRGRGTSDDEKEDEDDGSGDYVPGIRTPGSDTTPRKKLRTVASAPNLTASKRMRPGPKPRPLKSPQQELQSVFSAITPPLPSMARMASPTYHSEGEALYGSEDEFEAVGGNVASGSVPKSVIRSLYTGVAGHSEGGVKVSKRYICLIEGCGRTFPRKSAIESHIQTHLEDKPFTCPQPDCEASFVRQHDLRRHERIHSGNKPFPCPCGKVFARGDALARHRARGICEGSLVPQKVKPNAAATAAAAAV